MKTPAYDAKQAWTQAYKTWELAYPSEYVIRIFKGAYPHLNFGKENFSGRSICDVGCGDGRNLRFLKERGFEIYGTEISEEIVEQAKANLERVGARGGEIAVGSNDKLPFAKEKFD